jgi:hypothetical protein
MRKLASASVLAVALLLAFAGPSLAGGGHRGGHFHGGTRVFVGVGGPFWWWGAYPYPYYYYPPPYYTYTPPPVVVQEPPVYVQQDVVTSPPGSATAAQGYWYYCPSSRDYYPSVTSCPEAWIKVPPRQD